MLRKLTKRMLASILALSMVLPGSSLGTLQTYAEEAVQNPFFVDVDDADKTTTGESMKIQYSAGTTWKSAKKDSYAQILYNSSETYSVAGGTEYFYTMNFTGSAVQIFATVNTGHANCDVYIDDVYVGDLIAKGTKQQKQLVFETFGLANKEHVLKVVRKEGDTGAMQLDKIRVYTADQVNYADIDDAISTTNTEAFKIHYLPEDAWVGTANHPELFYDATEHYTQGSEDSLSYEMVFSGTGIAVSASLGNKHANCDVYIDDVLMGDMITYTSGDKQHKQILFETYGLEDKEHILRIEKKADDAKALQLDKIRVFYDTLNVSKLSLSTDEIRMSVGGERQANVTTEPWILPAEIEWSSADETVATVDENGLIKAVAEEKAETIITASVKGSELKGQIKVVVDPDITNLVVSVGNEKLLDTQREYDEIVTADPDYTWEGTAWKGDTLNSKIIVATKDAAAADAEVTASDFINEKGDVLSADNFSIKWLKEIEVYNGRGNKQGELLSYPDMIHKGGKTEIDAESLKFSWVAIDIPEDTEPGTYTGTISVNSKEMKAPVELTYTVKVIDLVQPELNVTDIQFWQHPFSVANYYLGLGDNVNIGGVCNESANDFYFTEKHLNLMRAELEEYASIGGHDLVATIVEEAWNHQSFYGDPSMIKWTKNADGTWTFDYTWFDIWVEFGIECGVIDPETGLGQIKCYSVVPWGNYVSYYDAASNKTVKKAYTPGNDDWKAIWTPFLTDFMAHTKEKGWFDITYISMDERTLDQLEPTVELIESLADENGVHFKISSCLNYSAPEYYDFTDHIHDISVGLKHTTVDTSNAMSEHRRELGLKTTYYTCTGDYPSNFIISDPGDNYWNAWYTMTLGTDGYLRWAWDNFLYDMHGNVSYKSWEPGDCWFIYPVEREEVDLDGDCTAGFYSTPRYEMLKQGLRDVEKAAYLMEQSEGLMDEIDALTGSIARPQKGSLNGSATYANETQRMLVHSETDRAFDAMTALAEDFSNGITVERKIRVACVGDSLTEGMTSSGGLKGSTAYPAYLQQLLGDDYKVENFGKSSMTMMKENARSYWNTTEFKNSLEFEPDIVIIILGSNDAKSWDEAAFRADAIALVNEYKALDTDPQIIFGISPHCYKTTGNDLTAEKVDVVIPVQRALAAENGWEIVDMYEKTEGKEYLYNADQLHFTDSGYQYLAQCVHEALTGEPAKDAEDASRDIPLEALRVTAEDSQSGEGPERVVDQDEETLWHTEWYGTSIEKHWIQFEVSENYKVDGLRYLPRQNGSNGKITKYEVQVSNDGESWEIVSEGTWNADNAWKLVSFEACEAKYVRLVSKEAVSGNAGYVFASAAEIRLTGFDADAPVEEKAVLQEAVDAAEAMDTAEYTEESVAALEEAITAAKAVLENEDATSKDVENAAKELQAAVDALEIPVMEEVVRVAGATRYETGYKVADALKETLGVEKFEAVVVATGKNFADALAGSYLAVRKNAPIILTNGKDDNIAQLHEYIAANVAAGGKVYILGGEGAVPAEVAAIDGYDVVRLSGKSRYETNLAILAEAGVAGDSIIVATGKAFADSLSASAAKLPILLVKPGEALSEEAKAVLGGMKKIYIIGGEGAVSADIAAELAAFGEVTRVAGKSRYETSVAVAETFFGTVENAVVASGKNFPDGLCGGPLAAAMNAPLILTADGKTDAAAGYMAENAITAGYVLGGSGALADESVADVFALESADEIVLK